MRVYGVRHGQSEYNLLGLCNDDPTQGVTLTALGRRQAAAAGVRLRGLGLEHIYSSPLPRAVQTAEALAAACDAPLMVEPRLADIRSGFDGWPVADYLAAIAADPLHTRPPGGESLLDHRTRINAFLDWLATRGLATVALVAHEETLRVIKARAEGLPPAAVVGLAFANAEPYPFEL